MRRGVGIAAAALLLVYLPALANAAPRCTIVGTDGPDVLHGTAASDVICGRGGADTITGGGGADRLIGGPGPDRLSGGPGADLLLGGPGNDELVGGPGKDTLLGGVGANTCDDRGVNGQIRGCVTGSAANVHGATARHPPGKPLCCAPAYRPPPDEAAPELAWLGISRRYVDTSAGDATVEFWLTAWDSSGISSIDLKLDGPGGPWHELELEGSANQITEVHGSVYVPASTTAGSYKVASLTLGDRVGNVVTLDSEELQQEGYAAGFEVYHGPDLEGPALTSFSISPSMVDTSTGPASIQFSMGASDALSGVSRASAVVELPGWKPGPIFPSGYGGGSRLVSGTIHDGTWEGAFPLVQHAKPGVYGINAVVLQDQAGNQTDYNRSQLEERGYPVEFTETGPGDTTPPEILGFWMEPTTLRASHGERKIDFYVHARDDLTGFGQWPDTGLSMVRVDFEPPGEWHTFESTGTVPMRVSGTELDGTWRCETVVEAAAPAGEYTIDYVSATDRAGNNAALRTAELEANGWETGFVNLP